MMPRAYIRYDYDFEGDRFTSFFGPFEDHEVEGAMDDPFGRDLSESGELSVVRMTPRGAKDVYINPRKLWIKERNIILEEE